MFEFITDKIVTKLRKNYYDSLNREVPYAYPANEIIDRILHSKKNSPFLFKLEKFLSKIDFFIDHSIIDVIKAPRIYYRNVYVTKTHVLETGLKKGEWHDEDSRLFHAMFKLAMDFIKNDESYEYYKTDNEGYPEHQVNCYNVCEEVTQWFNVTLKDYEKQMDDLYGQTVHSEVEDEDIKMWSMFNEPEHIKQQNHIIYSKINEIEAKICFEKKELMKKIVDVSESFWS